MNTEFMNEAFKYAKMAFDIDEVPIGAVIVKDNHIISSSYNKKESSNCCTAHAEMLAIEEASKALNNWRLEDCDIYVTLDPCPMCASAIKQARIKNVYSALSNSDSTNTEIIKKIFEADNTNPGVNFISNIEPTKSQIILNKFFKKQRNN